MRHLLVGLVGIALSSAAAAQGVEAPTIKPQDGWRFRHTLERPQLNVWQQTHGETTVVRVGADTMLVAAHDVGSTKPPIERLVGLDWRRMRSVNGRETIVNQPFSFPLTVGKTWDLQFAEDHPDRERKRQTTVTHYRVAGWEEVEVPAGRFKALKIEAEGQWTAELEPRTSTGASMQSSAQGNAVVVQNQIVREATVTGRTYKAFWYVPEVKIFVKRVEEDFNANGERSERDMDELESFHVAAP